MILRCFVLLSSLLSFLFTEAQNNLSVLEATRLRFPDSKQVVLEKQEHLNIDYRDGEWDIWSKINEKTLYLSDQQLFAQKSIYLSGFDEITNLEAKTLVPVKKGKKNEMQEFKVEKVETKDVMMGSIFYSDYKEKKFSFPALQVGATTVLSYTQKSKEPRLLDAFYFGNYSGPVLSSVFSVSFPKNIQIAYKLLGENTDVIRFETTEKNDLITYTWTAENISRLEPEENAPSSSYYEPHLVVYINKVTEGKNEVNVLEGISGLYRWYYSLVENINQEPGEELKQIVNTLVKDAPNDTEKTKRIYQWVQTNIRYIAFEDGLGGFVPREANDICAKKYGDCKDMSSILFKMLRLANVPAYYTWIGTRDKPYQYSEVPTPIVDNHMIATAKINNEYIFLDATGEYQPFGLPTSMIQGKEALIGINKDNYEIVVVPTAPMENNAETENLTLTIEGRTLNGSGNVNYTGYKKVFTQYDKLKADAGGRTARFYNDFLRKGSNKFESKNITPTGFKDNNNPKINIQYDFTLPDYVTASGDNLYVNLNLNRKYQQSAIDLKERKLDKTVEYKYVEDFTYSLNIPDGYEVSYLPSDMSFQDEEFGFTAKYTQEAESVALNLRFYVNHLLLKQKRFADWNGMIEKLNNAYQEVVVLKRKGQ